MVEPGLSPLLVAISSAISTSAVFLGLVSRAGVRYCWSEPLGMSEQGLPQTFSSTVLLFFGVVWGECMLFCWGHPVVILRDFPGPVLRSDPWPCSGDHM